MPSTSRADRVCFEGISIRLVTGCARVDAEAFLDGAASDTTLRARRDEWTAAGVFDALADEAIAAYDRIASLDFSEGAVDGSQLKAPTGGEGTGPNPTDRAKIGWKWSLFADRNGIPIGWATDGANRHHTMLLAPTLAAVSARALLTEIETLHLDRDYDNRVVLELVAGLGITDLNCAKRRPAGPTVFTSTRLAGEGPPAGPASTLCKRVGLTSGSSTTRISKSSAAVRRACISIGKSRTGGPGVAALRSSLHRAKPPAR